MLSTLRQSFQLHISLRINIILFRLKHLPLIKRLLPDQLYANEGLKAFFLVIAIIREIFILFLFKFFYIGMVYVLNYSYLDGESGVFLLLLYFGFLLGGIINNPFLALDQEGYYCVVLLRMDSRSYILSNYLFFLLKSFVGNAPFLILFGSLSGVPMLTCLLLPFIQLGSKLTFSLLATLRAKWQCRSSQFSRTSVLNVILFAIFFVFLVMTCVLRLETTSSMFIVLGIATIICGVVGFVAILRFPSYTFYIKHNTEYVTEMQDKAAVIEKTQKESASKMLTVDSSITSSKSGYAYLNDLFIKRHRKLLMRRTLVISVIIVCLGVLLSFFCIRYPNAQFVFEIHNCLVEHLPAFLFVLYILNPGLSITRAMYMNCDHNMLSLGFYRKPKALLKLFTIRLRSLITINLVQTGFLAFFVTLLLYLSGGTENSWNYLLVPFTLLAISVFFSTHYLVLYYLLQPYTIHLEQKSFPYWMVTYITYFVCYLLSGKTLDSFWFCLGCTAFCVIYIAIALPLVYFFAPKTFHNR